MRAAARANARAAAGVASDASGCRGSRLLEGGAGDGARASRLGVPDPEDRIRYAGYSYRHIAENIAYGYPNAAYAVGAWMTSAGHRANILDRAVVETGVGVTRAKTGELYFCQVFGAKLY